MLPAAGKTGADQSKFGEQLNGQDHRYRPGNRNSCVSILENGKAKVIENAEGGRATPSVIAYANDGEIWLVSRPSAGMTSPHNTCMR
ncbi:Hsp70 family protein [Stutzerimonas xanthomarina]|uniref:Hsp70 family protein n=1 Tax=Stutzerimonas xanthomarina TaxID=271420 RepID=UPI003AA7E206